jgi:hypothetical protein
MPFAGLALMDGYAWGVWKGDTAMTIEIHAIEFATAHEAIQWTEADGHGVAILLDRPLVVNRADADRLAAGGVEFAYLYDHEMPNGEHRIVTVPVND